MQNDLLLKHAFDLELLGMVGDGDEAFLFGLMLLTEVVVLGLLILLGWKMSKNGYFLIKF